MEHIVKARKQESITFPPLDSPSSSGIPGLCDMVKSLFQENKQGLVWEGQLCVL